RRVSNATVRRHRRGAESPFPMPPLRVGEVPLALEEGERVLVPVDDAEGVHFLLERAGVETRALDPAGDRIGQPLEHYFRPVLVAEAVLEHFQLQGPDRPEDRIAQAPIAEREDLDRAFLGELEESLLELLA